MGFRSIIGALLLTLVGTATPEVAVTGRDVINVPDCEADPPPRMLLRGLLIDIGNPRGSRLTIGLLLLLLPSIMFPPSRGLFTEIGTPRGFKSTIGAEL